MSPTPVVRLLPWQTADGATLMSADEALLHSATQGVATLRAYTWSRPTLSLGYFQPAQLRQDGPPALPLEWVRRSSGGGAIVHHHELTYALALPAGAPWQTKEAWTCRMHHLLVQVLGSFGITARTVVCGEEQKRGPLLCFEHHTPGDVFIVTRSGGREKVVGSAQRRSQGAILQHGSILLRQSEYAPSLPGIEELTSVAVRAEPLFERLQTAFTAATGFALVAGEWTDAERQLTREIREAKYGNPDWNERR